MEFSSVLKRTEAGSGNTLGNQKTRLTPPPTRQMPCLVPSFQPHCMCERRQDTRNSQVCRAHLPPTAERRTHMGARGEASFEPCQAESKAKVQSGRRERSSHIWESRRAELLARPPL